MIIDLQKNNSIGLGGNLTVLDYKKIDGRKSIAYSFVDRELSDKERDSLVALVYKMANICLRENGIGLALPQLGIFNGQLFIISLPTGTATTEQELFQKDSNTGLVTVTNLPGTIIKTTEAFFNPSYTYDPNSTTKESQIEGCLSVKTKQPLLISRPNTINASWYSFNPQTKTFTKREESMTGLRARVFMHEYDHLQGVSIVEKYKRDNKQQQQKLMKQRTHHTQQGV